MTATVNRSDIILHQIVNTDWTVEEGKRMFLALMNRYPDTNAVWTANYKIAYGVIEGMRELNLTPGEDILIVSFDLLNKILNLIKTEEVVATAGGHSIEAA